MYWAKKSRKFQKNSKIGQKIENPGKMKKNCSKSVNRKPENFRIIFLENSTYRRTVTGLVTIPCLFNQIAAEDNEAHSK